MKRPKQLLSGRNALILSAVALIVIVTAATIVTAMPTTSPSAKPNHPWRRRAIRAMRRARRSIAYATNVIIEQAESGANVTVAKGVLHASARLYARAEGLLFQRRFARASVFATLSRLVALDAARVAVNGTAAIQKAIGSVDEEIGQVEQLITQLNQSGVNVDRASRVLERARTLLARAGELLEEGRPVRAVVALEMSRILTHLAGYMAERAQMQVQA